MINKITLNKVDDPNWPWASTEPYIGLRKPALVTGNTILLLKSSSIWEYKHSYAPDYLLKLSGVYITKRDWIIPVSSLIFKVDIEYSDMIFNGGDHEESVLVRLPPEAEFKNSSCFGFLAHASSIK